MTRLTRPFALALWRADADPPSSPRRLIFRVPRWLTVLVPLRTIDLVQWAELVLAFALFGMTQSMMSDWNLRAPLPVNEQFTYLTALAVALPVALRDRWPLAAWRVAFVSMPLVLWVAKTIGQPGAIPYSPPVIVAYLLILYSVAVRCDRRITSAVWILTVLTAWIADPNSMPLTSVVTAVAVLFGYNVRVRRSATAKLVVEERRSQVAESAKAVLAERTRIARELHDVVAHHMSVIAIQAEAVPLKAAGDPVQLEAGLAEIRGLSLEAIAELRQVLGVLRDQDGRTDTAPQPGLDRVDELVSNARSAGLAVLVKRSGSLDGLPPAVELSAYRIVQESLSNVMRHAPGAPVALDITRDGDELRLYVANGPGSNLRHPSAPDGSGGSGGSDPDGSGPGGASPGGSSAGGSSLGGSSPRGSGLGGSSPRGSGLGGSVGGSGFGGSGVPGDVPREASQRAVRAPGRTPDPEPSEAASHATGEDTAYGGGQDTAPQPDRNAAHGADRSAARGAERNAARGADRSAARGADRNAARDMEHDAVREAGQDVARGAGQGLVGMRERAVLLGGTFDAGPVSGGGFEVRAVLPIVKRENA